MGFSRQEHWSGVAISSSKDHKQREVKPLELSGDREFNPEEGLNKGPSHLPSCHNRQKQTERWPRARAGWLRGCWSGYQPLLIYPNGVDFPDLQVDCLHASLSNQGECKLQRLKKCSAALAVHPTLFNPMDRTMPDSLVLHCLLKLAQTQHHWDWDRCHYTAVVTGQRSVRPSHCPLTKASATEHLTQVLVTALHHQHHAKQKGVDPFINYLPAPSHSNIQ